MLDLVTDNFSLPTPQSRHVRPTERLCLEDHVSPTGFRLQAGFQATTVTMALFWDSLVCGTNMLLGNVRTIHVSVTASARICVRVCGASFDDW